MIVDPVETGEGRDVAELASMSVSKLLSICHIKLFKFQILDVEFLSAKLNHVMRQITSSHRTRFAKVSKNTLLIIILILNIFSSNVKPVPWQK